eukprot:8546378-Lingulodinium_polyedra.AAC.1
MSTNGNPLRQPSAGNAWGKGRVKGARARPPWQSACGVSWSCGRRQRLREQSCAGRRPCWGGP